MRIFYLFSILAMLSFEGDKNKISSNDLKPLTGNTWRGNLIYLDYGTNKPVKIPADLVVTNSKTNPREWYFQNFYPKEPQENSVDTMLISKNGKMLGKKRITSKSISASGVTQIIAEINHAYDGEEKQFRYTYRISKREFSIKKEERKTGSPVYIERNTYAYTRDN